MQKLQWATKNGIYIEKEKLSKTEVTFKGKCYRMQELQKNGMYIAK